MRPHMPPRVTVLTTVYNGERYLEEAMRSVLDQELADIEYIVVDDGSTDGTAEILKRIAADDPRVIILRNEINRGIPFSANRGLTIARCEYVARLDADDVSLPGRFTKEMAVLDAHPDVALVSMNYESIDERGALIGRSHRDAPSEVIAFFLNFSNAIGGHSQVMIRRSCIAAVGGYDESCPYALDYDLWTRLLAQGRIAILSDLGMRYRVHDRSVTFLRSAGQTNVSTRVMRRTLSAYLGRELSDREATAVAHAWRALRPAIDPSLAHAVLREAYVLFCRRDGKCRALRMRVRREYARRLINAAWLLLVAGDAANAARHGAEALRWNAATALRRLLRLIASAIRRTFRSAATAAALR
jgi:glycosyltransferase involved in cell wall biosynthesis